jgi:hypothetical protein
MYLIFTQPYALRWLAVGRINNINSSSKLRNGLYAQVLK